MARLLTALALLLAFTITIASFASTAAARSVRLPGNGMTADGAPGAVDTAGGSITAESAPSFAQRSAGDEQSRRILQGGYQKPPYVPPKAYDGTLCDDVKRKDCAAPARHFFGLIKGKTPTPIEVLKCETKREQQLKECKSIGFDA